jgi:two-component system NtrC family sensor kinase
MALRKIAGQDFDLILSDLRMPGLDGPGLYRFLQQHRPELLPRIAFITGDTLGRKVRYFLDTVDRPYIEKPFTARQVREFLVRLIEMNNETNNCIGRLAEVETE